MQVKGFCTAEETINQTKRQWEKMFASHIPDLGPVDTLPAPQGAPGTWGEKAAGLHLSGPSSQRPLPRTSCTPHRSRVPLFNPAPGEARSSSMLQMQKFTNLLKVTQ